MMNSFEKLQTLYKKGDFKSFLTLYKTLEKPLADENLLLAIKLATSANEWLDIEDILRQLRNSPNSQSVEKAKLAYGFYNFVRKKLNRIEGKIILAKCSKVINNDIDSDLIFYAKKIQIKANLILLHQGLQNAEGKEKVVQDGLKLYKEYKEFDQEESLFFLEILVDYIGKHPLPNLKYGLEIIETTIHDGSIKNYNKISFFLKKARFLLRTKYPLGIENLIDLPNEIKDIISFLEENEYVPAVEMIESIYGKYLLGLEAIEGIKFLEKNILKLWELGYHREARNDYNTALIWMNNRGHVEAVKEFIQNIQLPKAINKIPLELEVIELNRAHKLYISGDYYNASKVLKKAISNIENETFQILFISTLVNNTSLYNLKSSNELDIIEAKIKDLEEVGETFLMAQLYAFKAMLSEKKSEEFLVVSAELYENLGMIPESTEQYKNYINQKLILFNSTNDYSLIEDIQKYLDKLTSLLISEYWIKDRHSLLANMYQVKGESFFYTKQFELAIKNFEEASNLYVKANHLILFAFNTHRIGGICLELGRKHKSINQYRKVDNNLPQGISILKKSNINNFIWRLQFIYTLTYSEPIERKLVDSEEFPMYIKKAEEGFDQTAFFIDLMIHKVNQSDPSQNLEATIVFKDDVKQVISSGTFFFQSRNNYIKAIEWLEKMRTRSLLINMTKEKLVNDDLNNHPLVLKEKQIIADLYVNNLNTQKTYSQNDLDIHYQKMIKDRTVKEYADTKRLTRLSIESLKKFIQKSEKQLKNRKLFFLYYFIQKDNIFVYGINSKENEVLFSKVSVKATDFEDYDLTFYKNINFLKTGYISERSLWTRYSGLITPLKDWTKPNDIICIIPFGVLQNLPLHALLINGKPLISRNPVFYNSSLSTWQYIQYKNTIPNDIKTMRLFGNPENDLEKAEEEVLFLAKIFNTEAILGTQITKSSFLQALTKYDSIHFAGHGSLAKGKKDHGFLSGLKLSDDILTSREIMNQNAKVNFVALASCDVGVQKNHSGEELVGLTSAFIVSGVNTVMTGLWEVDDSDAKDFFFIFYKKILKGLPKVIAMQETMIELMERPEKSHFCHWAMFSLNGDWR